MLTQWGSLFYLPMKQNLFLPRLLNLLIVDTKAYYSALYSHTITSPVDTTYVDKSLQIIIAEILHFRRQTKQERHVRNIQLSHLTTKVSENRKYPTYSDTSLSLHCFLKLTIEKFNVCSKIENCQMLSKIAGAEEHLHILTHLNGILHTNFALWPQRASTRDF